MEAKPKIVIHDVLQSSHFSASERLHRGKKPFFQWFKETMSYLEGVDGVILLVVASGIDKNKNWVEYIKKHPEWKVECYGWVHEEYTKKKEGEIVSDLIKAKEKIEDTFGQKVTEFFPPRNKRNSKVYRMAEKAKLKVHRKYCNIGNYLKKPCNKTQVDIHYWYNKDLLLMPILMKRLHIGEPTFIIGAPRSGTTALMRHIGGKDDYLVLKEVEKIWNGKTDLLGYYYTKLKNSGKSRVLDKNVRNSFRIKKILSLFPNAKFIHIIRDGRACAYSWKMWATKTNKDDKTLEHAARQWVDYIKEILKHKKMLKKIGAYAEIWYEDMCKKENYFVSRNYKWEKELSEKEIKLIEEIQYPFLKKFGYLKRGGLK